MKMSGFLFVLFGILLLLLFISCSTSKKIAALKPEPSNNAPIVYTTNTSFISMPIEVSLREIERQLNTYFTDIMYIDTDINDDNIEMKIWKTGVIRLEDKDGMIHSEIPLKIWTRFKYGTDFLGLNDIRVLNLKGKIKLKSNVELNNWKMTSVSEIIDFKWDESPTIEILGKKIPVTYIINPALNIFKKKIAVKIDETITELSDYQPYILDLLDTLSKPLLTSELYETWLKVNPLELFVTKATLDDSKVRLNMALRCTMMTMVGSKPENRFDKTRIKMLQSSSFPDIFEASVAAITTYENAGRIVTKNFKDYEFTYKRKKIKVMNVEMWYKDKKVILALNVTGSIVGTIYLSGFPQYDREKNMIYFSDLDYVLNTKNILVKTANWMAAGLILNKISDLCRYPIAENLDEARNSLLYYMKNYSPSEGVFVNGKIDTFDFDKMEISNSAMIAFIKIKGKVTASIKEQ